MPADSGAIDKIFKKQKASWIPLLNIPQFIKTIEGTRARTTLRVLAKLNIVKNNLKFHCSLLVVSCFFVVWGNTNLISLLDKTPAQTLNFCDTRTVLRTAK